MPLKYLTDPRTGNQVLGSSIVDVNGNPFVSAPGTAGVMAVSSDGSKATYRYALTDITPVATPTDWIEVIGSASLSVRIKWIRVRGFATTAGQLVCQLLRRSAVNTGGAVTALIGTPLDKNDGVATAVVNQVTTQRTGLGALTPVGGGTWDTQDLELALAGAIGEDALFTFCENQDKAGILRGVTDLACINFAGAALPVGTKLSMVLETEEDNS